MDRDSIDRKTFVRLLGRAGVGTCLCAAALGAEAAAQPQENAAQAPPPKRGVASAERAAKRMEFVDVWVPRFFSILDAQLDEPTRRRLMVANGTACFTGSRSDMTRRPEPATREQMGAWVAERGQGRGYRMEGDTIVFEYDTAAMAGKAGSAPVCLCPTAEAQTGKRMSPTFCWCSAGYVKEMHERAFGRPMNVELTGSVLMGQPRCSFRITVA